MRPVLDLTSDVSFTSCLVKARGHYLAKWYLLVERPREAVAPAKAGFGSRLRGC